MDAFVRANTLEKFGPVRTVKPELVFETRVRGHPGVDAAQVRGRGPVPPDAPLADRQDPGGRRHARPRAARIERVWRSRREWEHSR